MRTTQVTPLAEAIKADGIVQADLARQLDVSPAQVNRWVKGTNTPHRFYKKQIAKALGCKVDDLWPNGGSR